MNLMEDSKLDLDAPLLSVRRFSAGAAAPATPSAPNPEEEQGDQRPPPPRTTSLLFYTSGPVRVPGVIPFVRERTPGQPKNGAVSTSGADGRLLAATKPPPCRISNDKERAAAAPAVKLGNSVRTRKAVTFASDGGTAKSSESPEGGSEVVEKEEAVKVEEKPQQQPVSAVDNHDEEDDDDDDDDDAFSDALDTLSRTESLFMNCSVSGVSGIPDAAKIPGGTPKDPQVRDFMMDRFLPAAQAMACESPHYTFRRAASPPREPVKPVARPVTEDSRRPVPVPYQNRPNYVPQYAKELEEGDSYDDDEDYDDAGHLPSKACGLLPKFCLKSSFCLLNPVPGMKVRGHLPPPPRRRIGNPQIKIAHPMSLGRFKEEHRWEAVYRHKLGQECQPQVEEGSKIRSESKQLAYRSDSLTADRSSSCQHSSTGGTSPYLNEAPPPSLLERKGSLGVLSRESRDSKTGGFEKDILNHWENHRSRMGSGSTSPALETTLCVDSTSMPRSKSSSFNTVKDTRSMMSSGEFGTEIRRMEESTVVEAREMDVSQSEVSKFAETVLPFSSGKLNDADMNGDNNLKHGDHGSHPLHLNSDVSPLQSLLPPLSPKSPSESWLSRTLPSVMSKSPAPQSLLGIQLQPRKRTLKPSSVYVKQETSVKPSKPQHRQIRFAEVLAKPETPKSEI